MEVLWFFFSLFFSLLFPYLSVLVFLLWVLHIICGVFPVLFSFPCLLPLSVASSFPSLSNIQFLIHILFTLTFSPIVIKRTYILSQKKKKTPSNQLHQSSRKGRLCSSYSSLVCLSGCRRVPSPRSKQSKKAFGTCLIQPKAV